MREIKFRAWDKKSKKFTNTEYLLIGFDGRVIDVLPFEVEGVGTFPVVEETGGNYEIQQYTGLKDKNGKEIYEGDILRWWVSTTKEFSKHLLQIKWGTVGWILKSPMFASFGVSEARAECYESNTSGYIRSCEVIGNIHENPELIK